MGAAAPVVRKCATTAQGKLNLHASRPACDPHIWSLESTNVTQHQDLPPQTCLKHLVEAHQPGLGSGNNQ